MSLSNCLKILKGEGTRTPPRSNIMARVLGGGGGAAIPDGLGAQVPGAARTLDDDDKPRSLVLEVNDFKKKIAYRLMPIAS